MTAQLINVSDGYHVWSERYDRDMDDVFAVQDEIAVIARVFLVVAVICGRRCDAAMTEARAG